MLVQVLGGAYCQFVGQSHISHLACQLSDKAFLQALMCDTCALEVTTMTIYTYLSVPAIHSQPTGQ